MLCSRHKLTQNTANLQVYYFASSLTEHTQTYGATVGIHTYLRDCELFERCIGFVSRGKQEIFVFSKPPRQALGPARPFLQCILFTEAVES